MILPTPTFRIVVDYQGWRWHLAFDDLHQTERGLRLSFSAPFAPDVITVAAQIINVSQIDALVDRVCDDDDNAYGLARELIDLLVTLATKSPQPDCITYMVYQLCLWISENRRRALEEARVA
jgi:hypothetical protein